MALSNQRTEARIEMKASITVTVDTKDGETAYFKLQATTTFDALLSDIDDIVAVECIADGEEMGLWVVL